MKHLRWMMLTVFTAAVLLIAAAAFAEISSSPKTGVWPENYRNEVYLRTGEKGCLACHDDLYTLAQRAGPQMHAVGYVGRGYGKDYDVTHCLTCHTGLFGGSGPRFGNAIHTAHTPARGFTGDCNSCHILTPDGKFALWDVVKFDPIINAEWMRMNYQPANAADVKPIHDWLAWRGHKDGHPEGFDVDKELKGTMAMDQSKRTEKEDIFIVRNLGNADQFMPKNMADYSITVEGDVNTKKVFTLADLKKFKTVTLDLTRLCMVNPPGGIYVYDAEWTGIRLADILKEAGVKQNANFLKVVGYDKWPAAVRLDMALKRNTLLATKMNGQDIPLADGGPVIFLYPGEGGAVQPMWLKTIEVMTIPEKDLPEAAWGAVSGRREAVNSSILIPAKDGTVVERTTTIEGWAYAFHQRPVTRISLSADYGATWKDFKVPATFNPDRWVNWKFTWTAPAPGRYLIKVKAYADGDKTEQLKEANMIVVVK